MTGPVAGTLRRPFTFGRNANIKNGVKNARSTPYGRLFTFILAPPDYEFTCAKLRLLI